MMPTIAVPLLKENGEDYKVRTLLDSGSMTNWIAKGVLENVYHTVKGHTTLEVVTLTGSIHRRFKLVEVLYKARGLKQNINCYVINEFAQHMTVKGIVQNIIWNYKDLPEHKIIELADPNTDFIDHFDINRGVGMILCPGTTAKIRTDTPQLLRELGILLEPTEFGIAISGRVPEELRENLETISTYNIMPKIVEINRGPLFKVEEDDEMLVRENLRILGSQEAIGVANNEMHGEEKLAWEHFIKTTRRINEEEFEVRMPFNEKVHLLKSNRSRAVGRTRTEQKQMIASEKYKEAMLAAHQVFVERDSVEIVDPRAPITGPEYYMPFRGILKAG